MLGDWRAAAGEVGFWPECGHLARPTLGWKSLTGRPERKRVRVSYAVDGHCAPRSKCVGRPAPASARGHRPHPLDVQRQAHEVPPRRRTFAKPRRLNRRNPSTSLIHPFGASESHLRCAYRALPAGLAGFSPMRCVAASRAGSTGHLGLAFTPQRYVRVDAAIFQLQQIRARCSSPHRPVPPQARPQTSR